MEQSFACEPGSFASARQPATPCEGQVTVRSSINTVLSSVSTSSPMLNLKPSFVPGIRPACFFRGRLILFLSMCRLRRNPVNHGSCLLSISHIPESRPTDLIRPVTARIAGSLYAAFDIDSNGLRSSKEIRVAGGDILRMQLKTQQPGCRAEADFLLGTGRHDVGIGHDLPRNFTVPRHVVSHDIC